MIVMIMIVGGLTIGLYAWHCGEDIAQRLGKISANQRTIKIE
jgi:hypothetical protein